VKPPLDPQPPVIVITPPITYDPDPCASDDPPCECNDDCDEEEDKDEPEDKPEEEKKPCKDEANHKANPVVDMRIRPTASGNIDNGNYLGRSGNHYGIDIGEDGEPVYAMFDGTIRRVTNSHDDNKLWKDYTDQGPSAKTGNRVEYEAVVNGQTIYIQCWHMKNVQFSSSDVGSTITAGTILGYVGQTGNATATGSGGPHLHLQIRSNNNVGTILNPHDYLFSEYTFVNDKLANNGEPENDCDETL